MRPHPARGGAAVQPVQPVQPGSCLPWLPRLLVLQAAAGLDPEVALQRELARKLGLKRGKTKMGGEDGLDEFLEGGLMLF